MAQLETMSATLLDGRLLFARFPSPAEVALLRHKGYTCLVDLCCHEKEGLPSVECDLMFPIPDRTPNANVGNLDDFRLLARDLAKKIKASTDKVCIFCRGGHGRSAMLAAIVLHLVTACTAEEALAQVRHAHRCRLEMKPKWRRMGAPQTRSQKQLVRRECSTWSA
jgi:hypothetical protein